MARESDLLRSVGTLHEVLEHAPMGVLLVGQAANRILYANKALEGMLGYPSDMLEGQALDVLLPKALQAENGQWMAQFFAEPSQRRMSARGGLDACHADGRSIPVEISLAPISLDGQLYAIVYVSDVTSHRQMQRQFEQIFAAMPQGLLIVDNDGRIILTNPALDAQFGYAAGELVGVILGNLLPERYRAAHVQYRNQYLLHPTQRLMGTGRDLTGLHRSGTEFPVEIALCGLDMNNGRHALAIVSDISVRKKAEAALRQTNAQLEEFTYVASHDLRSPLRGIHDLLSWIREELPDEQLPVSVVQNFERIAVRIIKAERMIDDLLDYAHAGQRDQRNEIVDPQRLVEDVLALVHVPPDFRVEIEISAGSFPAAKVPLSLSLRNLLSNAVKHHGGASGCIRISIREEGRFNMLAVDDDGQGIPAGAEERIFKLFHRANTNTAGHGVGLAITRRMINAHGGSITALPRGPLGGASFCINWPRIAMKEVEDD